MKQSRAERSSLGFFHIDTSFHYSFSRLSTICKTCTKRVSRVETPPHHSAFLASLLCEEAEGCRFNIFPVCLTEFSAELRCKSIFYRSPSIVRRPIIIALSIAVQSHVRETLQTEKPFLCLQNPSYECCLTTRGYTLK